MLKMIKTITALSITAFVLLSFKPAPFFVKHMAIKAAVISWEKESYDFGVIVQAKPVSASFTFTNKGNEPILVSDVVTSCGCTASDYSKEPIMPGKSSSIKVTYNAANIGAFSKSVTVNFSDASAKKVLVIKGTVK
jgi:hypothetical protein